MREPSCERRKYINKNAESGWKFSQPAAQKTDILFIV